MSAAPPANRPRRSAGGRAGLIASAALAVCALATKAKAEDDAPTSVSSGAERAPPASGPVQDDDFLITEDDPELEPVPAWDPQLDVADDAPTSSVVHRRVARGLIELDVLTAGSVRGWLPQQYPAMDVGTTVYGTWQVDARLNIADVVHIRRAYYESSGLVAPRGQASGVAEDAADAVSRMAWLLGVLGVPITESIEPIVRYEARAFESVAKPSRPVRFVPYDASAGVDLDTIPLSRRDLRMVSTFETLILALQWNRGPGGAGMMAEDTGAISSAYLGGGYTGFAKPYMVRAGDSYLDEMVFESRFSGGGLAFGASRAPTPRSFYYDVAMQVGAGDVGLTHDLALTSTLPADWTIGYLQGNVVGGYLQPLVEGPVSLLGGISATLGGNYFFFTEKNEEAEASSDPIALNWDLLWSGQATLSLTM